MKGAMILGFALAPIAEATEPSVKPADTTLKKIVDNSLPTGYPFFCMNVTTMATTLKCKHCDKTFPTPAALQAHLKKVEAGKQGGYRKHRASRRYAVLEQPSDKPRTNGTHPTALDNLAEIRARKEQLLDAVTQTLADEQAAMEAVQREYEEQTKKLAAYSAEISVDRKVRIAVREEMEAHKQPPT